MTVAPTAKGLLGGGVHSAGTLGKVTIHVPRCPERPAL